MSDNDDPNKRRLGGDAFANRMKEERVTHGTNPPQGATIDPHAQKIREEQHRIQKQAEQTFKAFMDALRGKTHPNNKTPNDNDDETTLVTALHRMSQQNSSADVNILVFRAFLAIRDRINIVEHALRELNVKLSNVEKQDPKEKE